MENRNDLAPVNGGPIVLAAINAKWIHPSLALRLLKANLGELETRCEIMEFALRQSLAEKLDPIIAARPRILGLSVSIWNHEASLEMLKALYEKWAASAPGSAAGPGSAAEAARPVVVLGGPEVSFLPVEAEIFRYADYVIRGEGEDRFRELCRSILKEAEPEAIKADGFVNHELKQITEKFFIEALPVNLSSIKTAYHFYTDEDIGRKLIYVEASRGCPFGCEFCLSAAEAAGTSGDSGDSRASGTSGDSRAAEGVREFPLEPFFAEMDELIRRGEREGGERSRTIKFLDRTFNLNSKRAIRILDFFLERIKNPRTRFAWEAEPAARGSLCLHFEMVPAKFPPELRDRLRRFPSGSLRLEVGLQTLNSETAALIHRAGESEQELEIISFLRRETNAIIHADLIAGLPGEDLVSFGRGFDRLWAALFCGPRGEPPAAGNSAEIQLGILKLLYGAPIARHTEAFGMVYSGRPPYEVVETAALPKTDMDRVKNFARFWELIVNRGSFPDVVPRLFPPDKPVFRRFMELSDQLLVRFGRNWGIDRKELGLAISAHRGYA
jgi:radical SAM superfamily enzyme YgiQ (UPF0313 family)